MVVVVVVVVGSNKVMMLYCIVALDDCGGVLLLYLHPLHAHHACILRHTEQETHARPTCTYPVARLC